MKLAGLWLPSSMLVSAVLISLPIAAAAAPDTLIIKKDGKAGPGLAKSWKQSGDAVLFVLEPGADGAAAAKAVNERLTGAKASFDKGELKVTGLPLDTLLDQLSRLSLGGEGDPLADISGLGGTMLAMEAPEAGGSIRASKPTDVAAAFAGHDAASRFIAEVVEVKRGTFPVVTLKLRVAKLGQKTDGKVVPKGKTVDATVVYAGDKGIDLRDANNQRNMGAYYLSKGDKISAHAVAGNEGKLELDFVERQGK